MSRKSWGDGGVSRGCEIGVEGLGRMSEKRWRAAALHTGAVRRAQQCCAPTKAGCKKGREETERRLLQEGG